MTAVIGLPPPGALLDGGRFVLGEKYAEGGMSIVHLAMEKATERCLAVKLLIERYKGRPEREQRLIDEGLYLEELGPSPHIVELVSYGRLAEYDGWPFVATELMTGGDLRGLIVYERNVPLTRICDIAHQLAQAIRFVHEHGIVHRDITTSNIYVCRPPLGDDAPDQVKLFDFSHAGRIDGPRGGPGTAGRLTGLHDVPGTHGYMSPEQARAEPVTTAMDVFAFGAVLYELVTRNTLFEIRDRNQYIDLIAREEFEVPKLQAWAYSVPEALAELTNACTNLEPTARPSMDAVVEQLAAIRVSLGMPSEEPTERVPIERSPVWGTVAGMPSQAAPTTSEVDEQTDVELPFARPAHLRPTISPVFAAPPDSPVAASAISNEYAEPTTSRTKWTRLVFGTGLLLALGLGAWVLVGGDRHPSEDRDAGTADTGPAVEPELAAPSRAEAGTDEDTGSETGGALEVVPEVEPSEEPEKGEPKKPGSKKAVTDDGASKTGEPKDDSSKQPDPACEGVETEARKANDKRDWKRVAKLTGRKACWTSQDERTRLRVNALVLTGRFKECSDAGAGAKDPKTQSIVERCKVLASKKKAP